MPDAGILDTTVKRITTPASSMLEQDRQLRPPEHTTQRAVTLEDIKVGNPDGRGFPITRIYAVEPGEYAIYQADEVIVHFADDQSKAQAQRKSILPVSAVRAEVNALVQGLPCREICDR
jgi:hypothetical protein